VDGLSHVGVLGEACSVAGVGAEVCEVFQSAWGVDAADVAPFADDFGCFDDGGGVFAHLPFGGSSDEDGRACVPGDVEVLLAVLADECEGPCGEFWLPMLEAFDGSAGAADDIGCGDEPAQVAA